MIRHFLILAVAFSYYKSHAECRAGITGPERRLEMPYYTGSIAAVPTANKQKYIEHINSAWPLFQSYDASRMVETWGVDVQRGKVTDLYAAVNAKDDETV